MRDYDSDRVGVRAKLRDWYGFNSAQAMIIENYIYGELHSNWEDYLENWEDIADVFGNVVAVEQIRRNND